MGFYRDKTEEYFLLDTGVENIFIHEFMAAAPEGYLKVYLLALMHADLGIDISRDEIARHLNMEEEDILKAWNYWEKMGVIRKIRNDSEDQFDYDVEFVTLRQQMYGEAPSDSAGSGQQIGDSMADPQIHGMISEIEQITGQVFNSTGIREVISWIEDYHVLPEAVVYAFAYAKKNRRKSDIRYVGAIIKEWGSEGLRDIPSIEEHLAKKDHKNSMHRRIFQALGFTRNPTEEERRIMDTWFDEMDMPIETVLAACKKTSGISSPNINYVNKVLANWKNEGKTSQVDDGKSVSQQQINSYYEAVRARNEEEARIRREEVFAKVPRLREIEEEMAGIGPELSRLIISDAVDKKEAGEKLRRKEEELKMEKAFLLTDNGYEPDYMETRYDCPQCEDTGRLATGEACQCTKEITREKIEQTISLKNRK